MLTKFCQKCGTAVPPEKRKKARTELLIIIACSLLIGAIVSFFTYPHITEPDRTKLILIAILPGVVAAFAAFDIILLVVGYVKFMIRRPIWGGAILAAILLLAGGGYFIYWQDHSSRQFTAALTTIQDQLNEAAMAKLMGDAILAKKTIPGSSLTRVKSTAQLVANRLEFMAVPKELVDYQEAIIDWSTAVAIAADDTKTWQTVSAAPRAFQLQLGQKQSEKLLLASAKKISELKEFGDSAIKRKDRMTMLYVAAKLSVQEHWLGGLRYSENAGLLSFDLVSPALALSFGEGVPDVGPGVDVTCQVCSDPKVTWTAAQRRQYGCDTRCRGAQQPEQQQNQQPIQQQQNTGAQNQNTAGQPGQNQNTVGNQTGIDVPSGWSGSGQTTPRKICIGRGGTSVGDTATNVYCVEDVIQLINGIDASAVTFAQGSTNAQNGWNNGWHELEGLGVISAGESAAPSSEHTPTVQAFYDACQAKGGLVGGAGTVKAGLPTTESGYTCEYKSDTPRNGTQPCWDFLTYSGGHYMGGNTGCPTENLLPTNFDEKKLKALGGQWDGDYAVGGGTVKCAGDFAYAIPIPATTAPVRDSIMASTQGPVPINGNTVVWSMSISTQQGDATVSVSEVDTFRFFKSGNTAGVSATYSATITVSTEDRVQVSTCYGSVGGSRL